MKTVGFFGATQHYPTDRGNQRTTKRTVTPTTFDRQVLPMGFFMADFPWPHLITQVLESKSLRTLATPNTQHSTPHWHQRGGIAAPRHLSASVLS